MNGVAIVVFELNRDRLTSSCLSDREIDAEVQVLKSELDRAARKAKEWLVNRERSPFARSSNAARRPEGEKCPARDPTAACD
jgi:hypothetical protein